MCGEKCGSGRKQALDSGITPACAGKSFQAAESRQAGRDHPRVCGEKARSSSPLYFLPGSPPRMRGKVPVDQCNNAATGITPAYAGKRALCFRTLSHMRDHPRVCGEKRSGKWPRHRWQGSPPRMRGKAPLFQLWLLPLRITPAYAGKRRKVHIRRGQTEDHPRVCGEKLRSVVFGNYCEGSPPRMRGKGPSFSGFFDLLGITPAYAGKRVQLIQNSCPSRDHPRVCGEKREGA